MERKKVFILAINPYWTGISRLPYALKRAKLEVHTYCPSQSYLAASESVDCAHKYFAIFYSRTKLFYIFALWRMIKAQADFIIPGDEESVLVLQRIAKFCKGIPFLDQYSKLIRSCLYPKELDQIILHKELFIQKCHQLGIRAPKDITVNDLEDALLKAQKDIGYPLALKASTGYGGSGVKICHNEAELKEAYHQDQPGLFSKVKFIIKKFFFINMNEDKENHSLQEFIQGKVGLCSFVAFKGELLAANPMLKWRTYPGETGPTSVAKGHTDAELVSFARKLVKELNYTGFGSLDFIFNEDEEKSYLIELNPRPVPVSHFDSKITNDLAVCLGMALRGEQVPAFTFHEFLVALYPNELRRDPKSEFLKNAIHDVPNEEPHLREALLRNK